MCNIITAAIAYIGGYLIQSITDGAGRKYNFTYSSSPLSKITYVGGGSSEITSVSYVYDSANQLVRENNPISGKTTTWTYNKGGNIVSRKEYAYTTGTVGTATDTVNYTYGDSSWGDLLTKYDGVSISYDTIGNPLSDGTWTYSWKHGRQLASMSSGGTTWSFTYNADGLRTKRTNGSTTYNYVYNGDKLTYMAVGSDRIYFSYDAEGNPIAARWNNANYYYVSNIQGDIVAIVNSTGTAVVEYAYDAWGNIISTTGSMADTLGTLNPLRYRSYIYDSETGLYYLQSRYYNPENGRFLNADNYPATGAELLDSNMFAYCKNRPTVFYDPSGEIAWEVIGFAAAGAAVNVATSFLIAKAMGQPYTWTDATVAASSGALCTLGLPGQIAGGVIGGGYSAITTYQNGADGAKPVVAGVVSFASTFAGVGNFSGLDKVWSNLGKQAFIDLMYGTGSNFLSSATNLLATPKEAEKRPLITIEPAPPIKPTSRIIGPNVYTFIY